MEVIRLILTTFMEIINSSVYWVSHSIQFLHLVKNMQQGILDDCILGFWGTLCSMFLACELGILWRVDILVWPV